MSTWIYLECADHDPPISADGESGQHLYDLPDIREDIRRRAEWTPERLVTLSMKAMSSSCAPSSATVSPSIFPHWP